MKNFNPYKILAYTQGIITYTGLEITGLEIMGLPLNDLVTHTALIPTTLFAKDEYYNNMIYAYKTSGFIISGIRLSYGVLTDSAEDILVGGVRMVGNLIISKTTNFIRDLITTHDSEVSSKELVTEIKELEPQKIKTINITYDSHFTLNDVANILKTVSIMYDIYKTCDEIYNKVNQPQYKFESNSENNYVIKTTTYNFEANNILEKNDPVVEVNPLENFEGSNYPDLYYNDQAIIYSENNINAVNKIEDEPSNSSNYPDLYFNNIPIIYSENKESFFNTSESSEYGNDFVAYTGESNFDSELV